MRQRRIGARRREFFQDGIDIMFWEKIDENIYAAEPVTMKLVPAGVVSNPTLTIDTDTAQMLIDELWRCGLRPTEGTGSAGALAAVERHLADMQKIAIGSLKSRGVLVD